MSSSSSTQILAEYAKSKRSSCKKCSKAIDAKALRLGLVSRDARGFDVTKWHHLDCFNFGSESVASVEKIKGFQSLESSDQESLKKLVAATDKSRGEDSNESTYAVEGKESSQGKRVHEVDENENEEEERSLKKVKSSKCDGQAKLDISFTISDVKDKYKDATLSPKWKAFQTIIFLERDDGLHDSSKIAAFDFDGCLANTNVKRGGADAWSLMYPSIPDKLQSLYEDGYKLVIFTNESNIERWKNKRQVAVDSKIGRLNNFIKKVKVPIQEVCSPFVIRLLTCRKNSILHKSVESYDENNYVENYEMTHFFLKKKNARSIEVVTVQVFIACGLGKSGGQAEDPFRKPKPGMWHILEQHFNSGISIDMDQSFYVGDAAGRKNDHSDADIKFAEAVGLKFYVPEEYFGV
ncbi:polynucleotide 3'-phosphatase ZDP [Prunus persica]|uniref:polynucleotide 3'-phosphatase ZDP n=1 Tax=Prunus persica TaxID=3760 RepID=UPI0009AB7EA2|nr:polynucleotide 3'-phosphatase ZDP [Prunus persica]